MDNLGEKLSGSLTPSGLTTLVTVTDWKKDRIFGCEGAGFKIWSSPPDDTWESRSGKKESGGKKN